MAEQYRIEIIFDDLDTMRKVTQTLGMPAAQQPMSAEEWIAGARQAMPGFDIVVTPSAGAATAAETAETAETETSGGNGTKPSPRGKRKDKAVKPSVEEDWQEAYGILFNMYSDLRTSDPTGPQISEIKALLKAWGVSKFSLIPKDKGRELLAEAQRIKALK